MRVTVIGGGISGLVAASELVKAGVEVVLYEKEDNLGAHSKTATFNGIDLDPSSMLFNPVTEPITMEYLENLGFHFVPSDMSFSVSLDQGLGYEWGTRNGLRSLFSQKTNLINPYFLQLLREIAKFKDDAVRYVEELENDPDIYQNETLGQFIKKRGYSVLFEKAYLVPICASIWSCSSEAALNFSSCFVLSYFHTHHLLQLFDSSQQLSLGQRARDFVSKVEELLRSKGCQIKTSCEVESISTDVEGTDGRVGLRLVNVAMVGLILVVAVVVTCSIAHSSCILVIDDICNNMVMGSRCVVENVVVGHPMTHHPVYSALGFTPFFPCRSLFISSLVKLNVGTQSCTVNCQDGSKETYDRCIIAAHAPDALKMLGNKATYDELQILGAFQYVQRDIFFHHDKSLMPKNPISWSARNFLCGSENKVCLTYWLNVLQNVGDTTLPFLVTLDPAYTPESTLLKWSTRWPIPSVAATKASSRIDSIQGKRGIWFCGAYQGKFSGLPTFTYVQALLCEAGMVAADGILRTNSTVQKIPKHMEASLLETWARLLVIRFFKSYISTGCLIIYEDGGAVFTFGGTSKKSCLKSAFRVHNPQFYWKVATEAELGLADAYIHGDISFVNKDEGLLNLFMIFIVNNDLNSSVSRSNNKRGWWILLRFTAGLALARNIIQHVLNQNTVTQARRNISRHYDLLLKSNDLFATFLDETMTYSCAVFKRDDEDLKSAQLRKITALIEKARIEKKHEILDIGCGWGSLAIETPVSHGEARVDFAIGVGVMDHTIDVAVSDCQPVVTNS
ncbi:Amine oxidase [Dillenia turbinata]|uniref:Amine oxidase n=1 Tax=Dillenia turbinata TaxID=194707 RepID=A0AAN8VLC4_9MAGN